MTEKQPDPARLLAALDFSEALTELEQAHRTATDDLLLGFLEVMDSFDRLLADHGPKSSRDPDWLRAVRLIARQLLGTLAEVGVVPMDCEGTPVDPTRHQVVGVKPATDVAPDTIVAVLSRGYMHHERILRRPRVVVASAEEARQ